MDALAVVEHQLPGIEIQQQITDVNQISQIPQNRMCQTEIDNFKHFTYVNIGLIITDSHSQN